MIRTRLVRGIYRAALELPARIGGWVGEKWAEADAHWASMYANGREGDDA